MRPPEFISALLLEGVNVRPAAEGIWSVLPSDRLPARYDRRAAAYDVIVGSRLYNHVLWGSSPSTYTAFVERAVCSSAGPLLDAGCGSLVFTAEVYSRADRPLVLVDRSLGMLQAGRARLARSLGDGSGEVTFLQADIECLPFRSQVFSTVVSMGMLHLFDDTHEMVQALARVAEPSAQMYLTSLVAETPIGKSYLRLLYKAGEVAAPRTGAQLLGELQSVESIFVPPRAIETEGSMAFVIATATA
jgi:ubiquinone/menaquinone biosynthesis C-methylase UbiE